MFPYKPSSYGDTPVTMESPEWIARQDIKRSTVGVEWHVEAPHKNRLPKQWGKVWFRQEVNHRWPVNRFFRLSFWRQYDINIYVFDNKRTSYWTWASKSNNSMDVHRECVDLFSSREIKSTSSLTSSVCALVGSPFWGTVDQQATLGWSLGMSPKLMSQMPWYQKTTIGKTHELSMATFYGKLLNYQRVVVNGGSDQRSELGLGVFTYSLEIFPFWTGRQPRSHILSRFPFI